MKRLIFILALMVSVSLVKAQEVSKITDARNNVSYEAEVDGRDLIFDDKGKFLKEVRD